MEIFVDESHGTAEQHAHTNPSDPSTWEGVHIDVQRLCEKLGKQVSKVVGEWFIVYAACILHGVTAQF